jgi:hypothetical protein
MDQPPDLQMKILTSDFSETLAHWLHEWGILSRGLELQTPGDSNPCQNLKASFLGFAQGRS